MKIPTNLETQTRNTRHSLPVNYNTKILYYIPRYMFATIPRYPTSQRFHGLFVCVCMCAKNNRKKEINKTIYLAVVHCKHLISLHPLDNPTPPTPKSLIRRMLSRIICDSQ